MVYYGCNAYVGCGCGGSPTGDPRGATRNRAECQQLCDSDTNCDTFTMDLQETKCWLRMDCDPSDFCCGQKYKSWHKSQAATLSTCANATYSNHWCGSFTSFCGCGGYCADSYCRQCTDGDHLWRDGGWKICVAGEWKACMNTNYGARDSRQ